MAVYLVGGVGCEIAVDSKNNLQLEIALVQLNRW